MFDLYIFKLLFSQLAMLFLAVKSLTMKYVFYKYFFNDVHIGIKPLPFFKELIFLLKIRFKARCGSTFL